MTLKIGSLQTTTTVKIVTSSGLHVDQRNIRLNYHSASSDSNPLKLCGWNVAGEETVNSVLSSFSCTSENEDSSFHISLYCILR